MQLARPPRMERWTRVDGLRRVLWRLTQFPRLATAHKARWVDIIVIAVFVVIAGCSRATTGDFESEQTSSALPSPRLSASRLLRRVYLTLRGNEPTPEKYHQALDAEAAGTFDAFLQSEVDAALASSDFYQQMLSYGHDYLRIGDYTRGTLEGGSASEPWLGGMAGQLTPCAAGTRHVGKLGVFADKTETKDTTGDLLSICDSSTAKVTQVEPWWAPGTTVSIIGRAANPASTAGENNCGLIPCGGGTCQLAGPQCGCGPNLVFCYPVTPFHPTYPTYTADVNPNLEGAQRRLFWEEPARLFAHIVTRDEAFSDLVVGSYTVATRRLQHAYVRWGRMNSDNGTAMDQRLWWRTAKDSWEKVEVSSLHPNLLSERDYKFDPRVQPGAPKGYGAAGVLTMLGPNSWYPRERVRAARWLETFACRVFSAPDPSVVFSPPFTNDPKTQGPCQYCHATIEPAAVHFKRLEIEDDGAVYHSVGHANLAGIGSWQWKTLPYNPFFPDEMSPGGTVWYQPYQRWNTAFIPNTFLTPVTQAQLDANPDTRFIDFLPPSETLFGQKSDGTIGPLGFGKLVIASGEFDRCAVDRLFEHFMGRKLEVTREAASEAALVQKFVQGGRKVKPWVRSLVLSDEFKRGL